MTRSLEGWLEYVSAQHPAVMALGLERVSEVAGRMLKGQTPKDAPEDALRGLSPNPVVITVGGTNGKGSTCAMLERILLDSGYRVGLYTSPHLLRYNERVRVQGAEASDADLVRGFERVEAARGGTQLTYFEFGTLGAMSLFAESNLDAVIFEVGLGGRLDAVNIVDPDVAIVCSVDLDHQAYLGDTREKIGFEKAGIFRAGRPAIFGDREPPQSLVDHANKIGAKLQVLGKDFGFEVHERQWDFIGRHGPKRALPFPALRGSWQLKNASAALAALDEVAGRLPISLGEVKHGLATVQLPGRLQVLPGRPAIVLDVAHNPHAARSLADGLLSMGFFDKTTAVFAMMGDKDIGGVIDVLKPRIDQWHVATVPEARAAGTERLAKELAERGLEKATRTFATVTAALEAARRDAGPNDRILVFGTFPAVAEALRALR